MKKLFSFVCALVCAMSLSARDLYLVVGHSDWQKEGGRFAVYAFNSGEKWYDMTAVEGATNTYKATISDTYSKVIFCRMKGTTTENKWDNKWNQTVDIDLPTNTDENCYTVNETATEGKYSGYWSVYDAGGEGGEGGGTTTTYYIKHPWKDGEDASWTYKELTPNEDGTYSIRECYGGEGKGCNWKSSVSSKENWIGNPTLVGSPAKGDSAIFTLTSTEGDGAITITKIVTTGGEGGGTDPSVTEYWYFDENNTGWGTIGNEWKMTVSGDIAYVKVPAGKANKFKIFPCNPKVDAKVLANDDNIAESPLAGDIALSKDTEQQWKNICIGATTADYYVVLYLPNTATNSNDKYLVAAMTQLPNSGSTPTALTNTEAENSTVKVIRDGQVLIVREGVTYNMMGQVIQ